MRYASIYYRNYINNSLFSPDKGENSGEFFLPYAQLRDGFLAQGVELNTPDVNRGKKVEFELHINCRRQNPKARAYVYLYENPLIRPLNRDRRALSRYAKWFTWDNELMDDSRSVRLFYPNKLEVNTFNNFESRNLFCVFIASNKALAIKDDRSLYEERARIIKWYEKNAPSDFHLYGAGWDCPPALPGRLGRIYNKFRKYTAIFFRKKPFPKTWKGLAENKSKILERARFCIAYENCRDLSGYITEKLFDCFRSGCVPVYIGPKEIHQLIPQECFIDGRKFNSIDKLDCFLKTIDRNTYEHYQKNIKSFLVSTEAQFFSHHNFVNTIIKHIQSDYINSK